MFIIVTTGDSHRARIPAEINLRVGFRDEHTRPVYRQYKLDMEHGKVSPQ